MLFLLDLPKGEEVTILAQKKKDGKFGEQRSLKASGEGGPSDPLLSPGQCIGASWSRTSATLSTSGHTLSMRRNLPTASALTRARSSAWWTPCTTASWAPGWLSALARTTRRLRGASSPTKTGESSLTPAAPLSGGEAHADCRNGGHFFGSYELPLSLLGDVLKYWHAPGAPCQADHTSISLPDIRSLR